MTISANFPSIRPSLLLDFANEQALDPRITFTRSTTGAYYNGYSSAVAEQNLLTYSQDFTQSSWGKNGATVTGNSTTAPDGTTTAGLIVEDTTTTYHGIYETYTASLATPFTFSVYLKKQTRQYAFVGFNFSASFGAVLQIDLNAGTIAYSNTAGAGYSITASSITSVGSGWYRVVLTGTTGQTALSVSFGSAGATLWTAGVIQGNTFLGDGTSGVYAWGAQLEPRSSVTAYNATTTTAITNYIPVLQTGAINQARFDHNPTTGESLGLLIEEQSTNLITYSQTFNLSTWLIGSAGTVTNNTIVAPDGTLTGNTFTRTGATYLAYPITATAQNYTSSFYYKAGTAPNIQLSFADGGSTVGSIVTVNTATQALTIVNNGSTTGSTATITAVGNGWYRVSLTVLAVAGTYYIGVNSAVGTGTTFIWGAQLEAGAFATSYIPTVASQVTRSADSASMIGTNFSSWYNNAQGSVYIEAIPSAVQGASSFPNLFSISDGVSTPINSWGIYGFQSNFTATSVLNGTNTLVYTSSNTLIANTSTKLALSVSNGAGAFVVNGTVVGTNATTVIPPYSTKLTIGCDRSGGNFLGGRIKKLAYYPIAVTSAQLQALTGS